MPTQADEPIGVNPNVPASVRTFAASLSWPKVRISRRAQGLSQKHEKHLSPQTYPNDPCEMLSPITDIFAINLSLQEDKGLLELRQLWTDWSLGWFSDFLYRFRLEYLHNFSPETLQNIGVSGMGFRKAWSTASHRIVNL